AGAQPWADQADEEEGGAEPPPGGTGPSAHPHALDHCRCDERRGGERQREHKEIAHGVTSRSRLPVEIQAGSGETAARFAPAEQGPPQTSGLVEVARAAHPHKRYAPRFGYVREVPSAALPRCRSPTGRILPRRGSAPFAGAGNP